MGKEETGKEKPKKMEAPSRIELLHKGFADLSLTTWARRHHKRSKLRARQTKRNGAGDEIRTRDLNFGKVAFYH
jgi:hypothetical protein